jgi:hypothetical protein
MSGVLIEMTCRKAPRSRHGDIANDARSLATEPTDIGGAAFPQLFLM